MKSELCFIVACKADGGLYVLATRRRFRLRSEAELYTQSIATSREPIIVLVET